MHQVWNTIALAVRNLTLHKLRVLLTVLGLIFGVSSVIAMLAIAEGASPRPSGRSPSWAPPTSSSGATSRSTTSSPRSSRTTTASSSSTA